MRVLQLEPEDRLAVWVPSAILDDDVASVAVRRDRLLRLDHFRQDRSFCAFSWTQLIWHDSLKEVLEKVGSVVSSRATLCRGEERSDDDATRAAIGENKL